jgi:hypothetical protein
VCVRLWEWVVVKGARHGTSGVAMTCNGAMEALSQALRRGRDPAVGKVAPVTLVDGVFEQFYLHGIPEHVAEYREGVIRWRHDMEVL